MLMFVALLVCAACLPCRAAQQPPLALLDEADAAFTAGDFGRAAWLYNEVKRSYPESSTVRISLGSTYLKLGWLRYAGGEFSKALELTARTNTLAWIGLGCYYDRTNEPAQALLCYAHACRCDPANAFACRALGAAQYRAKDYSRAADTLLRAAALGLESEGLYALVGSCDEKHARWKGARDNYEKAFALNPNNAELARRLMLLNRDRFRDREKAVHYFTAFEKLNPQAAAREKPLFDRAPSGVLVTNPYLNSAGAPGTNPPPPAAGATQVVSSAEAQQRSEADYYASLAERSLMNELPKEAIRYYKLALEKDPRRAAYNREIARLYEREFHDLNLALKFYDRYLESCKNNDQEFQDMLAYVKSLRQQYDSVESGERTRRQEEEDRQRAEEQARQKAETERQQRVMQDVAQQPESYDSVINRGADEWRKHSDAEAARRYFQKAIAINPAYANAYYNLGLLCLAQTNFTAAIEYLSTALQKNPAFADSHLALGSVYDRLGKKPNATEHFTLYLELAPGGQYASAVRDWLSKNAGAQ